MIFNLPLPANSNIANIDLYFLIYSLLNIFLQNVGQCVAIAWRYSLKIESNISEYLTVSKLF